jgi:hypothetical protein
VGDVNHQSSPPDVDPERQGHGDGSRLASSCLIGFLIVLILALVVIPVLLWTLGIACGAH